MVFPWDSVEILLFPKGLPRENHLGGGGDPKVYIFFKLYFGKIRIVILCFFICFVGHGCFLVVVGGGSGGGVVVVWWWCGCGGGGAKCRVL